MNILMIRSDLKLAGPGVSIYRLSCQLRQNGHNVVIISSGGALSEKMRAEGFSVYEINGLGVGRRSILAVLRCILSIRRVLAEERIEVVHSHNMISTILTWLVSFGCGLSRRRFFTSIHGKGKEWLFRYVPGTLVGVSQDQLNYVRHYAPNKQTYCLYSSNSWISQTSRTADSTRPLRLISVGHFTGLKGQDRLVEVADVLRDRGIDFTLSMVGDGPALPGIRSKIIKMGLKDRISLLGEQSNIRDLLEQHDIFVHLPDYETFGIVCQEALCSGLPVVASKVGGIPEIVADSSFGILIDMKQEQSIARVADAIIEFSDPERYAAASVLSIEHVKTFSPDKILPQLIHTYRAA